MKFSLIALLALVTVLLITPGNTSGETCVENGRCPGGNDGYLLPHYECSKFFKCVNGLACEQDCPDGLHFNAYHQECEDPMTACCDIYLPCNPTQ